MIDIKIPFNAIEAAAKADYEMTREEAISDHGPIAETTYCPWEELSPDGKEYYMEHAAAALHAALIAWPGLVLVPGMEQWGKTHGRHLYIPVEESEGK